MAEVTLVLNNRDRKAPAITFGGRYSNNAEGQKLVEAFKDSGGWIRERRARAAGTA